MRCAACHAENPASQSFCGTCGKSLPAERLQATDAPTTFDHRPGELATGSTFAGRYQIVEELGRGGMGRVYKAIDTSVHEKIALKVLPPEMASDRDTLDRFSRELQLARRISHRNVCRLFDLGKSEGTHYLTMEFVPGEDLKRLIRKVGALSPGKIVRIARQLCEGLAEAHRLGIVHRDLKPQNVMVDEDGNAKILDFGIARTVRSKGITGPGVLIGTPQYMSPEQVDGGEVDPRSDLYSLGVILYEMATGQVPFDGNTPLSVAHQQKYDAPAGPLTLNNQLPADLGTLILKCLAKDRAGRHQSASDIGADLDKIEQGLPTTERALARKHTTSTQITIPFGPRRLLAGVAALVLVIVAVFLWRPWAAKVPVSPKTGKPTVAVTWFDNQSERAGLDGVVVDLLTTNLSREAALDVVSTQRKFDILRQLGKADAKTIDRTVATDVATRAGAGTMVTGTIVKLGEQVRITAEIVDVGTGSIVATLQEDGRRLDEVFAMVDRLTEQVRSKLGLSKALPGQTLKVTDVTTTSLDAYQHFTKATDLLCRWNYTGAAKELEQAVAIDPAFTGAWTALAIARRPPNTNGAFADFEPSRRALEEAAKHIERATDRERLEFELARCGYGLSVDLRERLRRAEALVTRFPDDQRGNFALFWTRRALGDLKGGLAAAERYLEINPADGDTYNGIAYLRLDLGDSEAAISAARKYVALYPDVVNALDTACEIHMRVGRFEEAIGYADRMRTVSPTSTGPAFYRIYIQLLREDSEGARREIESGVVATDLSKADYSAYVFLFEGRYREAEAALRKALSLAQAERQRADQASATGVHSLRVAHFRLGQVLSLMGRRTEAIQAFKDGEDVSAKAAAGRPDPYAVLSRYLMGTALVRSGDQAAALKHADEIADLVKRNGLTPLLDGYRDLIIADAAAARGDAKGLGSALDRIAHGSTRPDLIYPEHAICGRLAAVRAELAGDFRSAAGAYESFRNNARMASYGGWRPIPYVYERSRLAYNLGRLHEQQRDVAKAREQYTRFLKLMAKADPGLPDVEDAKKRLAALGPQ